MIQLLEPSTIDKIAAGEVVERPAAVVKELVENAIDAGANAITVEIKEGGISFIRITDNGCGIAKDEIPMAFTRHATSKIKNIEDLLTIHSLGFRGEALSSVAAVAKVELITKREEDLIGCRYEIQGGKEVAVEEVGCPNGSTFLIRNLFYNTPARAKFLKSKMTEGGYISDVMLHFTLSHPEIRFRFIWDGKTKIQTSGNGNVKDNIYQQFGADITKALLPIQVERDGMHLEGFVGKPEISRGTRSFMYYYTNGRHIKSPIVTKAIETAYEGYTMTNRFPFVVLFLSIDSAFLDVNVHPTKMEVRFMNQEEVYQLFQEEIHRVLHEATLIPKVLPGKEEKKKQEKKEKITVNVIPEPLEKNRMEQEHMATEKEQIESIRQAVISEKAIKEEKVEKPIVKYEQQSFFKNEMLAEEDRIKFRLIGQVFGTYWMIEYGDEMLIIDQHAAHEKILYEQLMEELSQNHVYSQNLVTPILITCTHREKEMLIKCQDAFSKLGFEIEEFGGDEFAIVAVPSHFLHLASKDLFYQILDELIENPMADRIEKITERCATISCKAAVKGNHSLSFAEANELIDKMLHAKDPYHCPHGRPTTISMSKKEFEKKFKRIVSG